ncbi:MAG: class I SAM-dependent methyltransferase [Acidobacteriota bacterium]
MNRGQRSDLASLYPTRGLRSYVHAKLLWDPFYEAVCSRLERSSLPLLDVGCGIGILSFYLRARGFHPPIVGIDTDEKKIDTARAIARGRYERLDFRVADARRGLEKGSGNVVMADMLHYMGDDDRDRLLGETAERVSPGGMVLIRDCVRDSSLRYRATYLEELLATKIGWLHVPVLNFPSAEMISAPFRAHGFTEERIPLWGRTPYNNYLFVFARP